MMKHTRRSTRLPGYDYSLAGAYFVTLVIDQRSCLLGEIIQGQCVLSQTGRIVEFHWKRLSNIFPYVVLGDYVIMPNHLHAILWLLENEIQDQKPVFLNEMEIRNSPKGTDPGSLGAVIQNFKSISTRAVNRMLKSPGKHLWQRNYHDRIIRNERELFAISEYILANLSNWEQDEEYSGKG